MTDLKDMSSQEDIKETPLEKKKKFKMWGF